MRAIVPSLITGVAALLGVLVGSWRQSGLQRSLDEVGVVRRWQQERRESYLRFIVADDRFFRGIVGTIRYVPRGSRVEGKDQLGIDAVLTPRSEDQRSDILGLFDETWRAFREIELFHLIDDDLLSRAKAMLSIESELVGLILYDLHHDPGREKEVSSDVVGILEKRDDAIGTFMHSARLSLDVPPSFVPGLRRRPIVR